MFRKTLSALAIIGTLAAVQPPTASAQAALACLSQPQGQAAVAQDPSIALQRVLQRIGVAIGQVRGIPCLAFVNGRYLWEIWVDTGGGPNRRVVDALSGSLVRGL